MKLKALLEDSDGTQVKQFALHLQQALLERFDGLNIELDSLDAISSGWQAVMTLSFDRYPRYQPQLDVSCSDGAGSRSKDCMVGISRRTGTDNDKDHLFIRTKQSDNYWMSPNDELVELLEERFLDDIGRLVGSDVNKRVTVSLWDDYEPEDAFVPFDFSIPSYMLTSSRVGPSIARATLDGLHVQCKAIRQLKKDPLGSAKASNDFNDTVLRKTPKPRQIEMKLDSSSGVIIFIYASHEAPTAA